MIMANIDKNHSSNVWNQIFWVNTGQKSQTCFTHPEKEVPNLNKIIPLNHYHHNNLEGWGNSKSQSPKLGF